MEYLITEYEGILQTSRPEGAGREPEMMTLVEPLCKLGDWTERGAAEIVRLVRDYGAFMLRNALALAVVLGKEDGDLGL
ncbi:MAG: hypothetical protein P4L55_04235 [Syntrophobacteraceae bacterium]|nr:hypothetical protein [Syntrophobacteraceae bacterium]